MSTRPYAQDMDATETTRSLAERLVRARLLERDFGSTQVQDVHATLDEDCVGDNAVYVEVILSEPSQRTWLFEETQAIRWQVLQVLTSTLPGLNFYTKFRVGKPAHA